MIIRNKLFECDLSDILNLLSHELNTRGIDLLSIQKDGTNDIQVQCPYHSNGNERHPSAGINKETGYFHCFTCHTVKSLPELVFDLLHEDGWKWLLSHFSSVAVENRRDMKLNMDRTVDKPIYLDKSELSKYRYYHNYLMTRKIPLDIARRYDLGYDIDNNCITFPIYDYNGNLLYFATRSIKGKHFHYPEGVKKPIYGIYQLNRDYPDCKEVIICESMINALTCISHNKPAIALNGTGTEEQYNDLLKFPYRYYILALDPDKAGKIGTQKLIEKLKGKKLLSYYDIPIGKDINDLTEEEFNNLKIIPI